MPTTIQGTITDLSTTALPGSTQTFVRFWLRGTNGAQPRVNGSALIASQNGTWYYFDLRPGANGVLSGTLYSTRDAAGTGNGEIEVGGSLTAVWYGMQVFNHGIPGPEMPIHAKNGVTLDISNVTPISTSPVSVAPSGDATYVRLDGGNLSLPVTIPFSATPVYTLPSAPSILSAFKITLSGNVTSSTMPGTHPGIVIFMITQNSAGGWTHAFPANVIGFQGPDPTPNAICVQAGFFDGTNCYPIGPQMVN